VNTDLQIKLERFCAYQERCRQDIFRKVASLRQAATRSKTESLRRRTVRTADFTDKDVEEILSYLENEKFIDENRYARIFAVSKLRQKQWGKHKITAHLRSKGISAEDIKDALDSLDNEEYETIWNKLISTKGEQIAFAHGF
jgi:regulatory protein